VQRRRALLSSSTLATIAAEGAGGTAVELGATFASKASGNENIGDTSSSAASGAEGEAESTEAESMSMSIALEASLSGDGTARSVGRAAGSHLAESFASADAARIAELGVEAISVSGFGGAAAGGEDAMTEASLHADTMIARTAECCDDGMTPFASSSADASTEGLVDGFATNSAFDAEGEAESVSEVRGSAGSLLEVAAVRGTGDTDIPFDAEAIASSATSGQVETYGTGDSSASYGDLFQSMLTHATFDATERANQEGIFSLAETGGVGMSEAEAHLGGQAVGEGISGVFLGGDTGGTVAGRASGDTQVFPELGSSSGAQTQVLAGPPVLAVATGYSGPGYAQTIGHGDTMSRLKVLSDASAITTTENAFDPAVGQGTIKGFGTGSSVITTMTEGVDTGSIGAASSIVELNTFSESFANVPFTAFGPFGSASGGTMGFSAATGDSAITFDSSSNAESRITGFAEDDENSVRATVTQLNAGQLGGIALGLEAQALELGLQSDASTEAFFVAGGTNSATAEGMTLETLDAMGSLVDYTFQPSSTSEINVVTDPIVGSDDEGTNLSVMRLVIPGR